MKIVATAVLIVAILAVSIGYALLSASHTFSNSMSIKGVGITVLEWISDTTPPTTTVTAHDWDTCVGGSVVYYQYICLKNTGTEGLTLSFSTTLDPSIGTASWQVEVYDLAHTAWNWKDCAQSITDNPPWMVGDAANPLGQNQVIGMRPTTPTDSCLGHIRIAITIAANAPFGPVTPFDITVTATEVAS
jgi:hypothetical protein